MTNPNQGLAYLESVLKACVAAENATEILVREHGETYKYDVSEKDIKDAAQWAYDVDGVVTYRIGQAMAHALYDGPYNKHNRAEIINDCNNRFSMITDGME